METRAESIDLETIAALQAFRKRHSEAQRIHSQLSSQPTSIDFEHYRTVLKNQAVVNEAEKIMKGFKPATYDVTEHIKAIEVFEAKAVRSLPLFPKRQDMATEVATCQVAKAEETSEKIDVELKELHATLSNIEGARPFEELTVRRIPRFIVCV